MTERERISHLLRRFGLGAGTNELARYEPLGSQGTFEHLLNDDKADEGFPIGPWEICFEKGKTDVYVDPPRAAIWWALRLMMTERPLEQRLTLFWSNLLVAGADKLEVGPSMVEYIEAIRTLGGGEFGTLLAAVSQTPAMLKYLDCDVNVKGNFNENFGREVMELFTLGIGNYSESDVKSAARAFSGWGLRYPVYEAGAEGVQLRIRESIANDVPLVAATYSPSLHDDSPKTILGETRNFGFDDTLAMLAGRKETALHIGRRLFEHFAYPNPEPTVAQHVAGIFTAENGNVRKVLREIAGMDEFWSDACIRKKVKSPVDFVITISRQLNVKPYLLGLRTSATPTTPLADGIRGFGFLLYTTMVNMGMNLLYPPNVKGWDEGQAWISSNTMMERMKLANTVCSVGQKDKGLPSWIAAQVKGQKPTSDAAGLESLLALFDADVFALDKKKVLLEAFTKAGGLNALASGDGASDALAAVARPIFGSPEFQMC